MSGRSICPVHEVQTWDWMQDGDILDVNAVLVCSMCTPETGIARQIDAIAVSQGHCWPPLTSLAR